MPSFVTGLYLLKQPFEAYPFQLGTVTYF